MRLQSLCLSLSFFGGVSGCAFLASQGNTLSQKRPVTVENASGSEICKVVTKKKSAKSSDESSAVEPPLGAGETREIKMWLTINVSSSLVFFDCAGAVVATRIQPYVKGDLSFVVGEPKP